MLTTKARRSRSEDRKDKDSPAQRPEAPGAARSILLLLFFVTFVPSW